MQWNGNCSNIRKRDETIKIKLHYNKYDVRICNAYQSIETVPFLFFLLLFQLHFDFVILVVVAAYFDSIRCLDVSKCL